MKSSQLSNLDDAWLHGETGQVLKNNGLSHNDAAWRSFGMDKWSALSKGHIRLQGNDSADGRPHALLKHRAKISGMIIDSLRNNRPFYLDMDKNGHHYSAEIHEPSDHAKAWDAVAQHAMPQTLPSQMVQR
jgi:hypothetical protein